ncbi:porin [Halorhodospira sp. 9621]|uniref:OprO/OprP family phosphate-selective porin n=1 Tax=Halorhodospira sp. 9621 TaxID=2899135 RepID=UPI001EE82900|nr:porin [Halorhodospira sp. 9621]MCG5531970.1 porin [Halorhodospira sp. 9621]
MTTRRIAPYLSTTALLGAGLAVAFPYEALANPEFDIRGRLQMDYHMIDEDETDFVDGFNNRRARLGMDGSIDEHWDGRVEINVAEGSVSAADFRLRRSLGPGRLWLGQYKVPQGLNQLTSSNNYTFMERSSVSNIIPDSRRIGIAYEQTGDELGFKTMFFGRSLGDDEGEDEGGAHKDYRGNQPQGYAIRGVYAPFLTASRHNEAPRLHLGASLVYEDQDDPLDIGFSDRPELRDGDGGSQRLIGTTVEDVTDTTKLGLEAAYISGPLSAEAEYLTVSMNRDNGDEPTFSGWHVQGSYVLTGESRTYSTGGFGGVTPSGSGGAWELAARYSHMDLNDSGFAGGEQNNLTLGINYYASSNLRLMGNVVFADVKDRNGEPDESPTLVGARAQYNW